MFKFWCSFLFFFIKAEMSLISSKGEEQNWVTQTPQLNAIWMASIFIKKKRQYSAQQSCYPLYFLLFCLSVIYQVSTVNMYYFFLLPFDPLYPFLLLTTLPWGRKELDTTERLNWTEPLPLATTNMFSVSMSFFFIWLFFFFRFHI